SAVNGSLIMADRIPPPPPGFRVQHAAIPPPPSGFELQPAAHGPAIADRVASFASGANEAIAAHNPISSGVDWIADKLRKRDHGLLNALLTDNVPAGV